MTTVRAIVEVVAREMGVTPSDILSHRRGRRIARVRTAAYWLSKELTPHGVTVIARAIGGRDHTTVSHGLRRAETLRDTDRDFQAITDRLRLEIDGVVSEYERGYRDGLADARRGVA